MDSSLNFNLFNSIILAGICQGLVFALVVFCSKKYNAKSTRFLATLILAFSLNNLGYYLLDIWWITRAEFFRYLYFPNALLSCPLFYFYVCLYLNPKKKFSTGEKWLFAPFIVMFLLFSSYKIAKPLEYENESYYAFLSALPNLIEFVGIIFTQIILVVCFLKVRKFEKKPHDSSNIMAETGFSWLKWIIISLFVLCLLWLFEMVDSVIKGESRAFYMLWIGMSVMTYWFGHIGIYKFGIIEERKNIRNYSIENKTKPVAIRSKSDHITQVENMLIHQKRFLDPTITLDKMADELDLSKSHLSRLINTELDMSFPDLLNSLRVEEAKMYLTNPEFANYTLIAIGLEAGFNSKTTFNNAFKKITGKTPSEFKNNPSL